MPSKRKKNKRRMRRVQALRRALEDQHAANPPIKSGPGIAASTPPAAPKKAAKTAAPRKIPHADPVPAPVVQIPKVEPELIVKEPVHAEVEKTNVDLLEQVPAEVMADSHVEVEVGAPADFETEAGVGLSEEPPVEWTPPVGPSTGQADLTQKTQFIAPQTVPVTEVKPPDEAPGGLPAVAEAQTVEAVGTEMEAEQTLEVCEPEMEKEAETEVRLEVEEDVTDFSVAETGNEFPKEPAAEDFSKQASAETGTEVVTETPEPEPGTESVSSAQEGEGKVEADVSAKEDEAAVCAEPVTSAGDAAVQSLEIPEVKDTILEALVGEDETSVEETGEVVAESLVDDDVSESASGVDDAITTSAVIPQGTTATSGNLRTQTESIPGTPADPEAAAAAAEDMLTSDGVDQVYLNVSSEEPKSEVCDPSCHSPLPVETVQLDSVEISVETTLNGHMVPEVSIEG